MAVMGMRGNTDAGRVEVFHLGKWGWICGNNEWDTAAAEVVCRQLGLRKGLSIMRMPNGPQENISGIRNAQCKGTEKDLLNCQIELSFNGSCLESEFGAVGVRCTNFLPEEQPPVVFPANFTWPLQAEQRLFCQDPTNGESEALPTFHCSVLHEEGICGANDAPNPFLDSLDAFVFKEPMKAYLALAGQQREAFNVSAASATWRAVGFELKNSAEVGALRRGFLSPLGRLLFDLDFDLMNRRKLHPLEPGAARLFSALEAYGAVELEDLGLPRSIQEQALQALGEVRAQQEGNMLAAARPKLPELEHWLHNSTLSAAVAAYFGGHAMLHGYKVVHLPSKFTTKDFVAAHWHHDRTGHRLKLLIRLNDVDPLEGHPTQVALGSHRLSFYWHEEFEQSRYEEVYVQKEFHTVRLAGKRGTGFLFDTNSIHKGTPEGSHDRDVIVVEYHQAAKCQLPAKAKPLSSCRQCDVAIVGGGVIGASVALHLAAAGAGKKVAVFESDASYSRASAPRSAGGIRQQFSLPVNVELSLYGVPGTLSFESSFADFEAALRENHAVQQGCGASWIRLMDPKELRTRFPWLCTDGVALGSFGERNEGYFDPWALLQAMRKAAMARGVEFIEQSVTGIQVSKNHIEALTLGDGTRVSVATVVNAAGAFGGHVVQMCGDVTPLPVVPRKRCMFLFHVGQEVTSDGTPRPPDNTPLTIDASGVYFRSEGSCARFLCLFCKMTEVIWPALAERAPALEAIKLESSWAGLYEYNTLDQNGVVGWHPDVSNLLIACGFSGHGLQQAPGVGRAVAELISFGGYRTIDLSILSYDRIQRNEPVKELKSKRSTIKKASVDLLKTAKVICAEGKMVDKMSRKMWELFQSTLKKKIRDALSLKKENDYQLPLGQVPILLNNVEPELLDQVRKSLGEMVTALSSSTDDDDDEAEQNEDEEEKEGCAEPAVDSRRAIVVDAVDYTIARRVESWNSRRQPGKTEIELSRPQLVHLWKKSNTRGGDFKQKRMNHVSSATLSYEHTSCQLTLMLNVVDLEYPGTSVERLRNIQARVKSLSVEDLSKDWEEVRRTILWAGDVPTHQDLPHSQPGQGYTGHSFNDDNHCDLTPMLGDVAHNLHGGEIRGIAMGNRLGPGIEIASLPELGPGGSWSTCTNGCHLDPPQDVAHVQFRSRIAFKLVWAPPDFNSFVLVDDGGELLNQGRPKGDLPDLRMRRGNYALVKGSKYAREADRLFEKVSARLGQPRCSELLPSVQPVMIDDIDTSLQTQNQQLATPQKFVLDQDAKEGIAYVSKLFTNDRLSREA
eukprot:g25145.t1